eukprot:scaffold1087_cov154-Amphora_coffeaeformis.AAC.1
MLRVHLRLFQVYNPIAPRQWQIPIDFVFVVASSATLRRIAFVSFHRVEPRTPFVSDRCSPYHNYYSYPRICRDDAEAQEIEMLV